MSNRSKQIYTILNLVNEISDVVYALDIGSGHTDNPIGKQLGINFGKDYSKYWGYLYKLYDMLDAEGYLSEIDLYMYPALEEIADERAEEAETDAHEDIMYSVKEGDKVRLSNGTIRYVDSIDGNSLWVTQRRGDDTGWSADLYDVVEILEHYEG